VSAPDAFRSNAGKCDVSRLDVSRVESATGWRVVHHALLGSTNDEAARLRAAGAGARTVVVADAQTAGRGREGRAFASPPGGLYASLLLAAEPADLPGPLVGAVALAAAEAVEAVSGCHTSIKWPNDLWIGPLKVGGILLEGGGGPSQLVIAGIGINVVGVPDALPADVRATLTALALAAGRPVAREALLIALLARVDQRLGELSDPAARARLGETYAAGQALLGRPITWLEGGQRHSGRLLAADLEGLEVETPEGARRRLRGAHVAEVRPAPLAAS
jgi:BirA family biotin operon repressor/biotin-[acetyl-CoA-carboxylase] ligase